jgi:hypothetical protein
VRTAIPANTVTCLSSPDRWCAVISPTADIVWTASGSNLGGVSNGRYFSIYDDTPTTWLPIR